MDGSDSTAVLVRQLKQDDRKLIVTTIEMANAVKSKRYESLMDSYRDKKVVFIIDECHRNQFGKMHGDIERHFLPGELHRVHGRPSSRRTAARTAGRPPTCSTREPSWTPACTAT